jgi:hypothetical protein
MIYLIKNISSPYDVITDVISELPQDSRYNVIHMPVNFEISELAKLMDMLYNKNYNDILLQHKNKFIIVIVCLKRDNTKEVIYANSYLNLLENNIDYNKLQDDPSHHYEILNYHNGKFEVHVNRDSAIAQLINYMNQFVLEYRTNIVKEFNTKEQFLEYINL